MMNVDKYGWRSESRPDIARELASQARIQTTSQMRDFVLAQDRKREKARRKTRGTVMVAALVVALLFVGLLIGVYHENSSMTVAQQQTLAEHPQDN